MSLPTWPEEGFSRAGHLIFYKTYRAKKKPQVPRSVIDVELTFPEVGF